MTTYPLLAGTVAAVAGVGPGFGRDVALALATHGADVVLLARSLDTMREVSEEIKELGRDSLALQLDVTDGAACEAVAAAAIERFGHVDTLVNNASVLSDQKSFEETDEDLSNWRRYYEVIVFGSLKLTRAFVPYMKERRAGSIVMVNSMESELCKPRLGNYASAKRALEGATRSLAAELGPYGIRLNGVHPGYMHGQAVADRLAQVAAERGVPVDEVYREVAEGTSLKYIPTTAEVAGTVVYLASPLSSPVTGQSIHVNAGQLCH